MIFVGVCMESCAKRLCVDLKCRNVLGKGPWELLIDSCCHRLMGQRVGRLMGAESGQRGDHWTYLSKNVVQTCIGVADGSIWLYRVQQQEFEVGGARHGCVAGGSMSLHWEKRDALLG
jgi:hypothetical protein